MIYMLIIIRCLRRPVTHSRTMAPSSHVQYLSSQCRRGLGSQLRKNSGILRPASLRKNASSTAIELRGVLILCTYETSSMAPTATSLFQKQTWRPIGEDGLWNPPSYCSHFSHVVRTSLLTFIRITQLCCKLKFKLSKILKLCRI